MSELLTSAQMRAIEQAAIESGEVTGLELMERAGRGVVEAIMEEWPELAQSSYKAVVLCGPGNNGGDGFVVARLLRQSGWEVEVFLYGDPEKLPPDAKVNYERWCELGEVAPLSFKAMQDATPSPCDLCVDALFGTGLSRPVDLPLCGLEPHLYQGADYRIVAIDMPTGLCSDSGYPIGHEYIHADLTVSFHRAKLGHFLHEAPFMCSKLRVVDLGLTEEGATDARSVVDAVAGMLRADPAKLAGDLGVDGVDDERGIGSTAMLWDGSHECRKFIREEIFKPVGHAHKYTHGQVLILSGLSGKTGAARLAARAALRVGAGLVTLGVPHEAVTEVAAQITAVMLTEIDTPEILSRVLTDARLNALCIGPGFGVERAAEFLPYVLAAKRATVLDADALTALSENEVGFAGLHENCVLTPHAGEFKRLFPDLAEKLVAPPVKGPAYSKVDATREAASRAGCTVLFKGPDTVIASPDGRCSINAAVYDRAAPWLATAGSGDVLSGLIAGLMARGFAPHHAAETAAYLHVEAARSFGPGLIAEDLPEELPKVFRALGM